jgi:hypothetical protein
LLLPPRFANGHRLSGHLALIVGQAAGHQMCIEFVKRVHVRQGHQEVAAVKADAVFDAALLMSLASLP